MCNVKYIILLSVRLLVVVVSHVVSRVQLVRSFITLRTSRHDPVSRPANQQPTTPALPTHHQQLHQAHPNGCWCKHSKVFSTDSDADTIIFCRVMAFYLQRRFVLHCRMAIEIFVNIHRSSRIVWQNGQERGQNCIASVDLKMGGV